MSKTSKKQLTITVYCGCDKVDFLLLLTGKRDTSGTLSGHGGASSMQPEGTGDGPTHPHRWLQGLSPLPVRGWQVWDGSSRAGSEVVGYRLFCRHPSYI